MKRLIIFMILMLLSSSFIYAFDEVNFKRLQNLGLPEGSTDVVIAQRDDFWGGDNVYVSFRNPDTGNYDVRLFRKSAYQSTVPSRVVYDQDDSISGLSRDEAISRIYDVTKDDTVRIYANSQIYEGDDFESASRLSETDFKTYLGSLSNPNVNYVIRRVQTDSSEMHVEYGDVLRRQYSYGDQTAVEGDTITLGNTGYRVQPDGSLLQATNYYDGTNRVIGQNYNIDGETYTLTFDGSPTSGQYVYVNLDGEKKYVAPDGKSYVDKKPSYEYEYRDGGIVAPGSSSATTPAVPVTLTPLMTSTVDSLYELLGESTTFEQLQGLDEGGNLPSDATLNPDDETVTIDGQKFEIGEDGKLEPVSAEANSGNTRAEPVSSDSGTGVSGSSGGGSSSSGGRTTATSPKKPSPYQYNSAAEGAGRGVSGYEPRTEGDSFSILGNEGEEVATATTERGTTTIDFGNGNKVTHNGQDLGVRTGEFNDKSGFYTSPSGIKVEVNEKGEAAIDGKKVDDLNTEVDGVKLQTYVDAYSNEEDQLRFSDQLRYAQARTAGSGTNYGFFYDLNKVSETASGFDGFSYLFMSGEDRRAWQTEVEEAFRPYTSAGWIENICFAKIDKPPAGTAFVKLPQGLGLDVAATIAGECAKQPSVGGTSNNIYKLVGFVQNPIATYNELPMRFDLVVKGPSGTTSILAEKKTLERGERFDLTGPNAFVQISPNDYNEVCVLFDTPPPFYESNEVCNVIDCREVGETGYSSPPSSVPVSTSNTDVSASSSQLGGSQAGNPEFNQI